MIATIIINKNVIILNNISLTLMLPHFLIKTPQHFNGARVLCDYAIYILIK